MRLLICFALLVASVSTGNGAENSDPLEGHIFAVRRERTSWQQTRQTIDNLSASLKTDLPPERKAILLYQRAFNYSIVSQYSRAFDDLQSSMNHDPQNGRALLLLAYCLWSERDFAHSRQKLNSAIRENGYSPDSHALSALLYSANGDKERALLALQALDQDSDSRHLLEAEVLRSFGDLDASRDLLQKCEQNRSLGFAIDPCFAVRTKAKVELDDHNFGKALAILNDTKEFSGTDVQIAELKCKAYWATGASSKALQLALQLEAELPDEYLVLALVGESNKRLKKPEAALRYFERCRNDRPDAENNILRILACYRELSKFKEAADLIADYRTRNIAASEIELVGAMLVLLDPATSLQERTTACEALEQVSRNAKNKFAERMSATLLIYAYGDREVAKRLLASIDGVGISEDDKLKLEKVKVAFSSDLPLSIR